MRWVVLRLVKFNCIESAKSIKDLSDILGTCSNENIDFILICELVSSGGVDFFAGVVEVADIIEFSFIPLEVDTKLQKGAGDDDENMGVWVNPFALIYVHIDACKCKALIFMLLTVRQ